MVQYWKEVDVLVRQGWDPSLAYMKRILDLMDEGALPELTNKGLRDFGNQLRPYPGIPEMFEELRELVNRVPFFKDKGIKIEYYVISGGLEEIIRASKIQGNGNLRDFWGCNFHADPNTGKLSFPRTSMSFTEKTRCLFQINKGFVGPRYRGKPGKVNEPMPEQKRPIPFSNMIYLGDGLTDIACMRVLEKFGGKCFGVFDVEKLERDEYRARSWLLVKREVPLFSAKYDQGASLRTAIEGHVLHICHHMLNW